MAVTLPKNEHTHAHHHQLHYNNYTKLIQINVQLFGQRFQIFLKLVIRSRSPINIIFNLFRRQFNAGFNRLQTQRSSFVGELLKLIFLVVFVHIRGDRRNHFRQC